MNCCHSVLVRNRLSPELQQVDANRNTFGFTEVLHSVPTYFGILAVDAGYVQVLTMSGRKMHVSLFL